MTLKQAAEETGRSKPTILRAIQSGKITAKKDEHGEWQIEPAELFRVYERVADNDASIGTDATSGTTQGSTEVKVLRREIEVRDETLEALRAERERERRQLEGTIEDLRHRLGVAEEERRAKDAQLTALLTDQRSKEEKAAEVSSPEPPRKPRGIMRRLFGG